MKLFSPLITAIFFSLFTSTTFAQQEELPPPAAKQKQAQEQYEKALQMLEQYRLTRPLSEERAKEVIDFFSKINPEIENEIELIKSQEPRNYNETLHQLDKEMRFLSRLQEEESERFAQAMALRKMEAQCNKIARQYRKSKDAAEKRTMEKELKAKLTRLFELKEEEKKLEIERIMERVNKMRQEMEERKANKEKIIDLRLSELTGKEHLFSW